MLRLIGLKLVLVGLSIMHGDQHETGRVIAGREGLVVWAECPMFTN